MRARETGATGRGSTKARGQAFAARAAISLSRTILQREAVAKLLTSHDVETVTAGTAAECLKRLQQETFDCMVLDLSLPDASGYSLLETLSQESTYAFPPVIVYTGRELSAETNSVCAAIRSRSLSKARSRRNACSTR